MIYISPVIFRFKIHGAQSNQNLIHFPRLVPFTRWVYYQINVAHSPFILSQLSYKMLLLSIAAWWQGFFKKHFCVCILMCEQINKCACRLVDALPHSLVIQATVLSMVYISSVTKTTTLQLPVSGMVIIVFHTHP